MSHLLVTGSSGTVGTMISRRLLNCGHHVVGLDRHPNPFDEEVATCTKIIDLREKNQILNKLPKNLDAIIHLAGNARVPHSVEDPSLARDNFESTFNILEFARQNTIPRFIFASSKDVYGNSVDTSEDSVRIDLCESPYAASKIASEALVFAYHASYDLEFSILRLSNVYGRYSEKDRVIPIFIRLCAENRPISVHGAEKRLDFIHADDLLSAFDLVLNRREESKNKVFNVASGEGVSLLEIAEQIRSAMKTKTELKVSQSRAGDVVESVSDISLIKSTLGFHPMVPFETGLQSEIDQFTPTAE
ncbi:MAG: SDR family NAD(P)-dependent oxidoreductase [Verrucomicrobiota bacterium]